MKSMGRVMPTILLAGLLAGCASTTRVEHQQLFGGRFESVDRELDQAGCDTKDMQACDVRDTIIGVETGGKVAALRVTQGPKALWDATDEANNVRLVIGRQGGAPVIVVERAGATDQCTESVKAEADKATSVTLPACGRYPAITAKWRYMNDRETAIRHALDRLRTNAYLLMLGMGGGELP